MKLTPEQYAMILARRGQTPQPAQPKPLSAVAVQGNKREADIHGEIIQECRRRGWIYFHGSMAHATKRTTGEPDFVILADAGRVLLVEVKRPGGKLSTDQIAIQAHARKLGHTIHVVYSFEEFMEIARRTVGVLEVCDYCGDLISLANAVWTGKQMLCLKCN